LNETAQTMADFDSNDDSDPVMYTKGMVNVLWFPDNHPNSIDSLDIQTDIDNAVSKHVFLIANRVRATGAKVVVEILLFC
jgi:hypothetical protein